MHQVHFDDHDPLYRKVAEAQSAMVALRMELHYLTCKSGVGRSRK